MNAMVVSATPKQLDSVGAVAHHDPKLGRGFRVDVVDADRVFRDDAQPLRGLHDPPADRSVAHRRAHERNRAARCLDHCIFMLAAGQLPGAVAEHELAAQSFKRVDGLGWLFARGKDENFRLGHAGSVAQGPNSA
jgi:hypothetical protein